MKFLDLTRHRRLAEPVISDYQRQLQDERMGEHREASAPVAYRPRFLKPITVYDTLSAEAAADLAPYLTDEGSQLTTLPTTTGVHHGRETD